MSDLKARLDSSRDSVVFSGRGTFGAKEQIKGLGPAKWKPEAKEWEIKPYSGSAADLRSVFPDLLIEEVGEGAPQSGSLPASEEEATEPTPLQKDDSLAGLPQSLTVGQLSARISQVISSAFPKTVFVRGVLTSVNMPQGASSWVFMDIGDEEAGNTSSLSCVIWRDSERICEGLYKAGFKLEPELQVMFEVKVGLNEKQGRVSLQVIGVVAEYTIGKLVALREQTNERLRKEKLFEKNHRLTLSFLPQRIGVITSGAGTVIHDFKASLDEAHFGFELFWCKASVQGSAAKEEILQALGVLAKLPQLDAVVIIRGGGSASDLVIFNDYDIAKAVCLCPVPVVAAIGHQENESSVQDVSFESLGVPKDVGRFFADIVKGLREKHRESTRVVLEKVEQKVALTSRELAHTSRLYMQIVAELLSRRVEALRQRLESLPILCQSFHSNLSNRFVHSTQPISALGGALLREKEQRLSQLQSHAQGAAERVFEKAELSLTALEQLIESQGPEVQLKRGFSIVRKSVDGSFVKKGSELGVGEELEVEFYDATRGVVVKE